MNITILDYKDRKTEVDVGKIEDITKMFVEVGTGDEILHVIYKDDSEKTFDSSNDRLRWYYDGCYDIYDEKKGVNILEDPKWLNRRHYSYLYDEGDCEDADTSDWW